LARLLRFRASARLSANIPAFRLVRLVVLLLLLLLPLLPALRIRLRSSDTFFSLLSELFSVVLLLLVLSSSVSSDTFFSLLSELFSAFATVELSCVVVKMVVDC